MAVGGDLFVVFSIPRGRAMPDTTTTAYGGWHRGYEVLSDADRLTSPGVPVRRHLTSLPPAAEVA